MGISMPWGYLFGFFFQPGPGSPFSRDKHTIAPGNSISDNLKNLFAISQPFYYERVLSFPLKRLQHLSPNSNMMGI